VAVSAKTKAGMEELLERCDRLLWRDGKVIFSEMEAATPGSADTV
jgi:hypothetical protein